MDVGGTQVDAAVLLPLGQESAVLEVVGVQVVIGQCGVGGVVVGDLHDLQLQTGLVGEVFVDEGENVTVWYKGNPHPQHLVLVLATGGLLAGGPTGGERQGDGGCRSDDC